MYIIVFENLLVLVHETNAKTNVALRKSEQSSKQIPENYNLSIQFPTNNLRRDQSAKTYPGKKFQNSSSSSWTSIKFIDIMQKLDNVPRKKESSSIPPEMTCVSGYWNKALRKWITYAESSSQNELNNGKRKAKTSKRNTKRSRRKKNDIYTAIDETDNEFETGGQNGKRMSFREFCRKKKKVMSLSDTPNKFIRL